MMEREPETPKDAAPAAEPVSPAAWTGGPSALTDWLKDMPIGQLHPLMQHPAAAMAAATAVGIGMTSQFAGFMIGAMRGFTETTQKRMSISTAEVSDAVVEVAQATMTAPAEKAVAVRRAVKPVAVTKPKTTPRKPVAVKQVAALPAETKARAKPAVKAVQPTTEPVARTAKKPAVRKKPEVTDDLKRISGIGPKVEQVLNGMGVSSYADIAGWSDEDVARVDEILGFGGRIGRDGWIEQAKALAKSGT